jgi:zinc protease
LLAAYLTDPGYREESLRRAHTGIEAIYTAARHTAAGVLQDQVSRYLAGGDFRFGLPARDEVMALAMDDVRDWLERPLGHAYLEIAVVGDFADVDEVIALAARSLGALPQRDAGKPDFSARRVVEGPEGGGEKRIEFESRIPSGIAAVYWPTADRWDIARDRRLSLLARVFSDRMRVRIREEMGEAYSPYAVSNTSGTYRDYGWFYGIVGVDPDQANPVADVMVEIARDLRREGISEGEMQRALRPVLTSIRDTVRTNRYWLESVLASSQEFPERLEWARTMSEDFAGITVEELESLVDEYLDPDSALRVILLPVDASGQVLEPEEAFAPVGAQ